MDTTTSTIINIFTPQGFVGFIQFMVLIMMLIYVFIAFVLTRQVKLMNKSFHTPYSWFFTTFALIHMALTIVISFFAITSV